MEKTIRAVRKALSQSGEGERKPCTCPYLGHVPYFAPRLTEWDKLKIRIRR